MSRVLLITLLINSTVRPVLPGEPSFPTSKTSSWKSVKSLLNRCLILPLPARRRPCPSNPKPYAAARAVNNLCPVRTPTPASRKHGLARPNGPNRKATVPAAGGLFFPQAKSLGIDQTETSPALQQKIVYAGVACRSFAQASVALEYLADLQV